MVYVRTCRKSVNITIWKKKNVLNPRETCKLINKHNILPSSSSPPPHYLQIVETRYFNHKISIHKHICHFAFSLLFAVRSDRLMQQVNKHRPAANHSKRLFIVHLQKFLSIFSLSRFLYLSFMLPFSLCPLLFVFLPVFWESWTAHLRELSIDLLHWNIGCGVRYCAKILPTFRKRC